MSLASACYSGAANMHERDSGNDNQMSKGTRSELTEAQVRALLAKEFGGLFDIDDRTISPAYLPADFNGDGVQDLAIAVRTSHTIDPTDSSLLPFRFQKAYGPGPSTKGEADSGPQLKMSNWRADQLPRLDRELA